MNENYFWNGIKPIQLLENNEWSFDEKENKWLIDLNDGFIDNKSYVTSFKETKKFKKIDLYKFKNENFWNSQPIIYATGIYLIIL
jgi:hypothetical protein